MRHASKSAAGKIVEIHRNGDTRERAIAVARTLFAERGYRGASLRDIARRIGIKAPSLLHHFSSKQQLYVAVLNQIFDSLEDAANALAWGRDDPRDRMRQAVGNTIEYMASHPDLVRILWKEMADDTGVGRNVIKRRLPPLFSIATNFIFRGQREGVFRPEVDPVHFVLSLNSLTVGYFTTAAMARRLWGMDLLEPATIERRKREVIDMIDRTLFIAPGAGV